MSVQNSQLTVIPVVALGSSEGSWEATPNCETAVLGSNPAISSAYSELPVLRWAAVWGGTLLKAVLSGVAEENMIKKNFCSTKNK
jgi:hypothetical protein